MVRDVEVSHAHREVDGIDVLESLRQKQEVRSEEEDGERADCSTHGRNQTGRRRSASLRLPSR